MSDEQQSTIVPDPCGEACAGVGVAGPGVVVPSEGGVFGSVDSEQVANSLPRARSRVGVILGSHTTVDVYSAFVPPIIGLLEVRCDLSTWQTASLLGVGR